METIGNMCNPKSPKPGPTNEKPRKLLVAGFACFGLEYQGLTYMKDPRSTVQLLHMKRVEDSH